VGGYGLQSERENSLDRVWTCKLEGAAVFRLLNAAKTIEAALAAGIPNKTRGLQPAWQPLRSTLPDLGRSALYTEVFAIHEKGSCKKEIADQVDALKGHGFRCTSFSAKPTRVLLIAA